jgi:ABC-type Mn2+/Zn2+ transport system permease subunit
MLRAGFHAVAACVYTHQRMSLPELLRSDQVAALTATVALASTCSALSVFVVARRWAFIGEGIGHSGFGGAGLAWMLALLFPWLDQPWLLPIAISGFCLATAVGIGLLTRRERINVDAAIGIFLVASLAWGFLAQAIYLNVRHVAPQGYMQTLFGDLRDISGQYAVAAAAISAAVLLTLAALGKEVVAYCLDPVMAEASGVRVGFIHHLLLVLIALTIVIGIPLMGAPLVTAMLVLPGTTAALLSDRLGRVIGLSIAGGLLGALSAVAVGLCWRFLPTGPLIVIALLVEFLAVLAWTRRPGRSTAQTGPRA